MPSPSSSTRPTSRDPGRWWKSFSSSVMTETTSPMLKRDMTAPLDDLLAGGFQPRPHRSVVQPVADAHHQAAQQVWLDPRGQDGLLAVPGAQPLPQALALVVGKRHGAGHEHAQAARAL